MAAEMTVKEALRILLDVEHAEDWIYAVREREGMGWEGPRVAAYSAAMAALRNLQNYVEEERQDVR